jgi:Ion channel
MKSFLYKLFLGKPEYNQPLRRSAYFNYRIHIYKIWENASHNDIGFEKVLRLFLVAVQILFPGLHYRNYWAKHGLAVRNVAIEFYVLFKTVLPLIFLCTGFYRSPWAVAISCYLLLETVFYVSALIFVSDMFLKPRSYRRNILMLFFNYLEISFSFAVIYAGLHLLGDKPQSIVDYIYFSIVTSTTIGYGDILPATHLAKMLVCMQAIMVVAFVVLFLNFFGSKVENLHRDDEK